MVDDDGNAAEAMAPGATTPMSPQPHPLAPEGGRGSAGLSSLVLTTPCTAFVEYAPTSRGGTDDEGGEDDDDDAVAPRVLVGGGGGGPGIDGADAISASIDRGGGLHVRWRSPGEDPMAPCEIRLLLPERAGIRRLEATGTGDVVVGADVLVDDPTASRLQLRGTGTGRLFLRAPIRAANATLSVSGERSVIVAPGGDPGVIDVGQLHLDTAGSGDIRIHVEALTVRERLAIAASGRGRVYLHAATSRAAQLAIAAEGQVGVYLGPNGTAHHCAVDLVGAVHVNTGGLCCDVGQVAASGMGEVTIQARRSLDVSSLGFTAIYFFGPRPEVLHGSAEPFPSTRFVSESETIPMVPVPKMTFPVSARVRWEVDSMPAPSSDGSPSSPMPPRRETPEVLPASEDDSSISWVVPIGLVFGAVAVLVLLVIGRLTRQRRRRHRNHESSPLLGAGSDDRVFV